MFTPLEKQIIRELQTDLPLVPRVFAEIASRLGIPETELLAKISEMLNRGYLKRIGAILYHQRVGYTANSMVVWRVPEESLENAGRKLASHPAVSHCYQRKTAENWPYNLYTMVHHRSREGCLLLVQELADSIGVYDYQLLYSTRELKKSSMVYFNEDEAAAPVI